jgi:hypothetical protein
MNGAPGNWVLVWAWLAERSKPEPGFGFGSLRGYPGVQWWLTIHRASGVRFQRKWNAQSETRWSASLASDPIRRWRGIWRGPSWPVFRNQMRW